MVDYDAELAEQIAAKDAKIAKLRLALTHCLGLLCESGNLNNYRSLSDKELGRAWIETAREAATVLDETESRCKSE